MGYVLNIFRCIGIIVIFVLSRDILLYRPVIRSSLHLLLLTPRFTERINQTLEHYLRQYCNYEQNDWYEMLPLADYSYNNSVTTATQMSHFYANYGFHPRTT